MDPLKIFLASSSELKDDRIAFELYVGRRNKVLVKQGIFLELVIWEDFLDALSENGLQKEYNKAIRECDVFVMLYFTKVGKYTAEEFEAAIGAFHEGGKPQIFTYFKDAELTTGGARREDLQSLWAFQDKLKALGHYQTVYKSTEDLLLKFGGQLERILGDRSQATASTASTSGKGTGDGGSGKTFSGTGDGRIPGTQTGTGDGNLPPSTQPSSENRPPAQKNYNLKNIIKLLTNAFDATGLETFALINFEDIHRQFTPGMSQQQRITLLVTQVRNHGKLDALLAAVKEENDYQYGQCGPYITA